MISSQKWKIVLKGLRKITVSYQCNKTICQCNKSSLYEGGTVVKNLLANSGVTGDAGLIPRLGRSLEEEMATYSSILAWKILEQRSQAGYCAWGPKESDMT